jgi:predicted HAD superfamily phosphohydrolase YqeG
MKSSIKEIFVYLPIIGKISGENLSYINTQKSNAIIGDLDNLLVHIKMDAQTNINVIVVMDGKNKNITLIILN